MFNTEHHIQNLNIISILQIVKIHFFSEVMSVEMDTPIIFRLLENSVTT